MCKGGQTWRCRWIAWQEKQTGKESGREEEEGQCNVCQNCSNCKKSLFATQYDYVRAVCCQTQVLLFLFKSVLVMFYVALCWVIFHNQRASLSKSGSHLYQLLHLHFFYQWSLLLCFFSHPFIVYCLVLSQQKSKGSTCFLLYPLLTLGYATILNDYSNKQRVICQIIKSICCDMYLNITCVPIYGSYELGAHHNVYL